MSEYFDILNPDGTPTGKIKERNAVHHDGDLHGSVHIWLFRETEEEISLKLNPEDLHFLHDQILTVHQGDFISNEFNRVYFIDESVSLDTLKYDEKEITELRFFEIEDLKDRLKNKEKGFCMTYDELIRVIDCAVSKGLLESRE